jgi:predicted transposase YdaD
MGEKDIISKHILKNLVRDFAIYLFGLPVTQVELLETQRQRVEERRADLLAKVALPDGQPLLLHIEIQNGNEPQMPCRMMRYLSDILLEHPGQPVRQYLVYIGKQRLGMADGLDTEDVRYRYRTIDLHSVDCEEFLKQDSPDAWVLAILCDFKSRLPKQIIHTILARLVERFGENLPRLREYVDMLDILAVNRDLNVNIREELKMLSVIDVEKLATYQLGMEKGMEKGIEKGIERGIEQGIEQGILQGADIRNHEIAKNMLAQSMETDLIVAVTGLPLAEIERLRNGRAEGH